MEVGGEEEEQRRQELEKSLVILEENWEKVLRSHGRRIRFSFSLEQEPV